MKTPNFSQAFDTASVHLALQNLTSDRLRPLPLAAKVELAELLDAMSDAVGQAKAALNQSYSDLYGASARAQLLAQGKDSGTTHILEDDFDISIEIDKTVKWDQKQLAAIFERIAASGEKATDYIDLKYGVSETRFKSWPETLKKPFEAARTVTPGKPRFAIRRIGEDK